MYVCSCFLGVCIMKHPEEYTSEEEYEDNLEQLESEVNQWQRYFEEEIGLSKEDAVKAVKDNWIPSYNKWLDDTGAGGKDWWTHQDMEIQNG